MTAAYKLCCLCHETGLWIPTERVAECGMACIRQARRLCRGGGVAEHESDLPQNKALTAALKLLGTVTPENMTRQCWEQLLAIALCVSDDTPLRHSSGTAFRLLSNCTLEPQIPAPCLLAQLVQFASSSNPEYLTFFSRVVRSIKATDLSKDDVVAVSTAVESVFSRVVSFVLKSSMIPKAYASVLHDFMVSLFSYESWRSQHLSAASSLRSLDKFEAMCSFYSITTSMPQHLETAVPSLLESSPFFSSALFTQAIDKLKKAATTCSTGFSAVACSISMILPFAPE